MNINYDLCLQCQGACCKRATGPTLPTQFGSTEDEIRTNLHKALDTGDYIVDAQAGRYKNIFWTVRPRMTEKGCVFLTSHGCIHGEDTRPAACLSFIPSRHFPEGCRQPYDITLNNTRPAMVHFGLKWLPYKHILEEWVSA